MMSTMKRTENLDVRFCDSYLFIPKTSILNHRCPQSLDVFLSCNVIIGENVL